MSWMFLSLRRYADFSGRSCRKEFWSFFGLNIVVFIFWMTFTTSITPTPEISTTAQTPTNAEHELPSWAALYLLWWAGTIIPWIAVQIRRFHDQGRTGWLVLLNVAYYSAILLERPLVALLLLAIILMYMGLPGEKGPNQYGPDPLDLDEGGIDEDSEYSKRPAILQSEPSSPPKALAPDASHHADFANHPPTFKPDPVRTKQFGRKLVTQPRAPQTEVFEGRYFAGGYSFSTEAQAASYLARKNGTASHRGLRPAKEVEAEESPFHSPSQPIPNAADIHPGIKVGSESESYVNGHAPNTTDDTHEFAESSKALPVEESQAVSDFEEQAEDRDKIQNLQTYRVGGYVFSTRQQAKQYAIRLNTPPPVQTLQDSSSNTTKPENAVERSSPDDVRSETPEPTKSASMERWISSPEKLNAGGFSLITDLVYFGKPKERHAYPSHNSLIDPALPVASSGDPDGSTFSYWPEYGDLDPRARRTYLEWLANGRTDPDIPIGYVFIFFYGLERRFVFDRSEDDYPAIITELKRLLAIYNSNGSFGHYCKNLLEFAQALNGDLTGEIDPARALDFRNSYEIALPLRIRFGEILNRGEAFDAEHALCWLLALPDTYARTPARRCFDELLTLWSIRFDEIYPDGLKVRTPKTTIKVHYRPAASGYHADLNLDHLPDISSVRAPVSRLRELFEKCTEELDAYSRYLGRSPGAKGTISAAALLPPALLRTEHCAPLLESRNQIVEVLEGNERANIAASQLFATLGLDWPPDKDSLAARDMNLLAQLMDALNIGFEPDRRYGTIGKIEKTTDFCIFPASIGGPVNSESPQYSAARTMLEIGALAATADSNVVRVEVESLQDDLSGFDLSDVEVARLIAHADAMLHDPPKSRSAINRLLALPENERHRVTQSAISAVLADGRVLPSEVKFLEQLHKSLGLPADEVYSRLHRGDVEPEELSTISPATSEEGVAIPTEERAITSIRIDSRRLARLRQETSEVSSLLADIFVDDETHEIESIEREDHNTAFDGLDFQHGKLLSLLISQPMEPDDFEICAKELNILPAGALETINEWAFENFDEPAIDDDDMIIVVEHLLDVITELKRKD